MVKNKDKNKDKNNSDPVQLLQAEIGKKKRRIERKEKGIEPKPRGKPFEKGFDERRNIKGSKPQTATLLKQMILDMAGEEMEYLDPYTGKTEKVSAIYFMLRRMMLGKAPADHTELLNRGFGKVADETRNLSEIDDFILNNMDLFTDGQIQRIQKGESKAGILAELLQAAAIVLRSGAAKGKSKDK